MTTFVLVHGAWHGAWCWEDLTPELDALGMEALAIDLPCSEVSAGVEIYAESVCAGIDRAQAKDVVVVGHSLGGLTIPLVAEHRPVSRLVFLCPVLPRPGEPLLFEQASDPAAAPPIDRDERGRTRWVDKQAAGRLLYGDCPAEVAERAFARLRPQAERPMTERSPVSTWPPSTPCSVVACRHDRVVLRAQAAEAARERLGVEPVELPGSHSPFFSRPALLARELVALREPGRARRRR